MIVNVCGGMKIY